MVTQSTNMSSRVVVVLTHNYLVPMESPGFYHQSG